MTGTNHHANRVGEVAELLANALDLIAAFSSPTGGAGIPNEYVESWLSDAMKFGQQLSGARKDIGEQIEAAISSAYACGVAGDPPDATIGDLSSRLLHEVDIYGDRLPLVRAPALLEFDSDDPAEVLAQAIYGIASVLSGQDDWSDVERPVKDYMRSTAKQLIDAGIVVHVPSRSELTDDEKLRVRAELDRTVEYAANSDVVTGSFHVTGCNRAEPHNGYIQGECTHDGDPIIIVAFGGLPPNLPMPPGFSSDSERGEQNN